LGHWVFKNGFFEKAGDKYGTGIEKLSPSLGEKTLNDYRI